MNAPTGHDPAADLPPLSPESIDRMETALFARIAEEAAAGDPGTASPAPVAVIDRRARRRRGWVLAGSVAAAFVVGVVAVPAVTGLTAGAGLTAASAPSIGLREIGMAGAVEDAAMPAPEMLPGVPLDGAAGVDASGGAIGTEVITSVSASIRVADPRTAADELVALATAQGGAVESLQLGTDTRPVPYDAPTGAVDAAAVVDYGWVSLRVPSDRVDATIAALDDIGRVTATSRSATDVTATAIDLRARIASLEASVDRLTELMGQSGSVGDLIQAETALTERQSQLESYQQQLADLEGRVAMSSIQIDLTRATDPVTAEPAGFWDGLAAGWAGMLVSLNAVVIALGFALPWLVLAGVVVLIVRLVVVRRRRTRTAGSADDAP